MKKNREALARTTSYLRQLLVDPKFGADPDDTDRIQSAIDLLVEELQTPIPEWLDEAVDGRR